MTTMPKTSRAAVLTAHNAPIEVHDLPVPQTLEKGAMLVRIVAATICGSDVHLWDGSLAGSQAIDLPVIPGHEMIGSIVARGEGTELDSFGTPLTDGDRVLFTHAVCGHCFYCRTPNMSTLCTNRKAYMMSNCSRPPYLVGGFSEYVYVFPESGRIRVPDSVDTAVASACSCALRTVMHSFERLGKLEPWQTVVVQGAGPLGLFATAVARDAGAQRVITIGAPDDRLAIVRTLGADETISVQEHPAPEDRVNRVLELTDGQGADVIFEFSGARTAFDEGIRMSRYGARYVVTGQIDKPGQETTVRPGVITRRQLSILGTWSGDITHCWQALKFVEKTQHTFDFSQLITNRYGLDEVTKALTRMRNLEEIKPVIVP